MLTLQIKGRWFRMIAAGEKPEEYREIKKYWGRRFIKAGLLDPDGRPTGKTAEVLFVNGYGKDHPAIQATVKLSIGQGRPEWATEPVSECPPVKELNRLRKYEIAIKRLGRFGDKLLRHPGDPRGPEGRAANKTLAEEATEQLPFRDAEGERWVPVKADVLFELIEENKRLKSFDSGEKISPLAAARARNSLAADPAVYAGPALGRDDNGGGQDDRGEQL